MWMCLTSNNTSCHGALLLTIQFCMWITKSSQIFNLHTLCSARSILAWNVDFEIRNLNDITMMSHYRCTHSENYGHNSNPPVRSALTLWTRIYHMIEALVYDMVTIITTYTWYVYGLVTCEMWCMSSLGTYQATISHISRWQ